MSTSLSFDGELLFLPKYILIKFKCMVDIMFLYESPHAFVFTFAIKTSKPALTIA
ncbi:hypothetical protein D3C76_790770 [compost metagenome]